VAETASNREKQQPPLIGIRFQVKPATLLIPLTSLLSFVVEEISGTQYQSGSFSFIKVGSGFYCLRTVFNFQEPQEAYIAQGCNSDKQQVEMLQVKGRKLQATGSGTRHVCT